MFGATRLVSGRGFRGFIILHYGNAPGGGGGGGWRLTALRDTHQSIGQGSPLNKSGMKTLYFVCSSLVARISAPWMVWSKKPKMSKMSTMPFAASEGPVTSFRWTSC